MAYDLVAITEPPPGSRAQVKGTDLSVIRIWDAADFAGLGNNRPAKLRGIQRAGTTINTSPPVQIVIPIQP